MSGPNFLPLSNHDSSPLPPELFPGQLPPTQLTDRFGRRFSYLRLSITDACNFKCVYCLPQGYQKADKENFLSLHEIRNLVQAFSELGMWKIRLTGGEPTLRRDLIEIIQLVSGIQGVQRVALSTNGYRLKYQAKEFQRAGVRALNISVDSLNREKFHQITGSDSLPDILEGIDHALSLGFDSIKVNAVLLKDWNEEELDLFAQWILKRPITVRMIELMPTGQNLDLFQKHHRKGDEFIRRLQLLGWTPLSRKEADGPAQEFEHPDSVGKFGMIAPYSEHFCSTCNRLRVTSSGQLRLCLFGEGSHSIRHLIQKESQKRELIEFIIALLQKKEISHYLPEGRYGNNQTFSAMGG